VVDISCDSSPLISRFTSHGDGGRTPLALVHGSTSAVPTFTNRAKNSSNVLLSTAATPSRGQYSSLQIQFVGGWHGGALDYEATTALNNPT